MRILQKKTQREKESEICLGKLQYCKLNEIVFLMCDFCCLSVFANVSSVNTNSNMNMNMNECDCFVSRGASVLISLAGCDKCLHNHS